MARAKFFNEKTGKWEYADKAYSNSKLCVTSVNGIVPDENGNVEIEVSSPNVNLTEPAVEDIPKVFFVGTAPTTKAEDELPLTMEYRSKTKTIKSYVTLKVQGDSSASYPKKNFNLKMFSDEARSEKLKCTFRDWSNTHKYCLKANWIDHTHARNVVNGRLWGQVVRSRADFESYPTEYKESANCGAVNGFPVKVYLNGVYQGIYTWNIRKDSSMFNMDDETGTHAALIADDAADSVAWRVLPTIDGTDWTDELNDVVPDAVKTGFSNAVQFVMNSTDDEFKANVSNYFYLSSLIDYYIFINCIQMIGGLAKSQTVFTYDAHKFLANIYDMDTTWALHWNGGSFYDPTMVCPDEFNKSNSGKTNLLYDKIAYLYIPELKARFKELRAGVLSDANIINEYERFMDVIPLDLYAEDFAETTAGGAFAGIPSATTNNIQKLREIIVTRMAAVDAQFEAMVERIPATGISLDKSTLSFDSGDSQTIIATVTPADTTDKVVWTTSDSTVANVTDGVVTPNGNGNCVITARAGAFSATCNVTVANVGDIADGYASDGLEVRLDAIRNTVAGHDATATNWEDVSGNGYATTCNKKPTVNENYLTGNFTTKVTDAATILEKMGAAFTIELLFSATSMTNYPIMAAGGGSKLILINGQFVDSGGTKGTALTEGGIAHYTLVYDGTNATMYHAGVEDVSVAAAFDFTTGENLEFWGYAAWSQAYNGIKYAARLYNRALSAEEVLANYNNDVARFGLTG